MLPRVPIIIFAVAIIPLYCIAGEVTKYLNLEMLFTVLAMALPFALFRAIGTYYAVKSIISVIIATTYYSTYL